MSDEVCLQVVDLYLAERKRGAAGGNLSSQCVRAAWETSYQWKAERVMAEENCFKVSTKMTCDTACTAVNIGTCCCSRQRLKPPPMNLILFSCGELF